MNRLLFNSEEYQRHYNCTFFDFDAAIPRSERKNVFFSIVLIIWTIILQVVYIASLCVMMQKKNFQQSCYKLMVYLGVIEIFGLCETGLAFSYFMIRGDVYCSSPIAIYMVGLIGTCLWFAESSTSLILAFNRCLIVFDPNLASRLFDGSFRIVAWLAIPNILMIWTFWHANPFIVSPLYFSPYFDPFIGFFEENPAYGYRFYFYYNMALVIVLVVNYFAFCAFLFLTKRRIRVMGSSKKITKDFNVFLQVLIICILSVVAIVGYLLHEAYSHSKVWALIATYGYVTYQGGPALIYLSFNSSVKHFIMRQKTSIIRSQQNNFTTTNHSQKARSVTQPFNLTNRPLNSHNSSKPLQSHI